MIRNYILLAAISITILVLILNFQFVFNIYAKDRWEHIKTTKKGISEMRIYYDSKTIEIMSNGNINVWIKQDYVPDVPDETNNKKSDYSLVKMKIFCSDKQYQFLQMINYFDDGSTKNMEIDIGVNDVVPESFGEILFDKLCY